MRIAVLLCLAVLASLALSPYALAQEPVGDAAAGARVFRKCASCHTATDPGHRVGPSLQGVVGRPVASAPGYTYSAAMAAFGSDGKRWDAARLAAYLVAPRAMVPGTRMSFAGLKADRDIADVITYLATTAPHSPERARNRPLAR